jgi:phosphomevalonate kinase
MNLVLFEINNLYDISSTATFVIVSLIQLYLTLIKSKKIKKSSFQSKIWWILNNFHRYFTLKFKNNNEYSTLSAPGKALIAGGYLVLDSSIGVTIASTSRFFATVTTQVIY